MIDLSPARLREIVSVDPELSSEFGQPLEECLSFFDQVRSEIAPPLLKALNQVIGGSGDDGLENYMANYRCSYFSTGNNFRSILNVLGLSRSHKETYFLFEFLRFLPNPQIFKKCLNCFCFY